VNEKRRRLGSEHVWVPGHTLFPRTISQKALEALGDILGIPAGTKRYTRLHQRLDQIVAHHEELYAKYAKPNAGWYRAQITPLKKKVDEALVILRELPGIARSDLSHLVRREMKLDLHMAASGAPSLEQHLLAGC